jgi:hypothetical protein
LFIFFFLGLGDHLQNLIYIYIYIFIILEDNDCLKRKGMLQSRIIVYEILLKAISEGN